MNQKLWYVYTMKYYTTVRKDKNPAIFHGMDGTWGFILSKTNQKENDRYRMLSPIGRISRYMVRWGWSDNTVGKTFICHAPTNWISISSIPYGPMSIPGVTSEFRTRSNSWALPGMSQKQTNKRCISRDQEKRSTEMRWWGGGGSFGTLLEGSGYCEGRYKVRMM